MYSLRFTFYPLHSKIFMKMHILKFADDTVIVSFLHNNKSSHGPVLKDFIS